MIKNEALKMAIEYIETQEIKLSFDNLKVKQHTLQACKEALEQQSQNDKWGNPTYNYAVHHKVAPAWQGISEAEAGAIFRTSMTPHEFARAIEQALKEKNKC